MKTKDIGKSGEDIAVRFLKKSGYKIVERNFSVPRMGEIDIVALDGEYVVFVEVRLRSGIYSISGADTVDKLKQKKLIKAAQAYLKLNAATEHSARFDVVSITGDAYGKYEIELIRDAFGI